MKVAVAVIADEQRRILVTQRPMHASHGGRWEFPGGKLEAGELAEHALIREVKEEVGLDVIDYQLLGEVHHQYSDKKVQLIIFLVTQFSGTPSCIEGQLAMEWIKPKELNPDLFPEANREVIKLIPVL